MSNSKRDRMDSMVMGTTDLHCFRFVAPTECGGSGDQGYIGPHATNKGSGVYLRAEGHGGSPCPKPQNAARLLQPEQALALARAIDIAARPTAHSNGSFNRGLSGDETFPESTEAFVRRWYEVLARRLDVAIDAAESRRTSLRELRAALTGEVGDRSRA